ncbi:major capsid protein [Zavarzinia compransoris]|uniref:Phage capsid protein n=1 Tax=Zavarzinia compransoris TaxID=1264899 RepID=A0A317EB15_9PROT|nr:major capsid protein [Zavarzinia compransoris]PWR23360.1 hypothetical protein DKG75_01980 [Zavarzinia compransoris]TDP46066.1 major capsid protein E [Zavarzinia compransoris]
MTTSMSNAQVRVIDPILTTHAQGYRHPDYVGETLFPRVPVAVSGGRVIEFGLESFRRYNLRRAPGAATQRISFGYAGKPFALVQDALEATVPREHSREAQVPGINLAARAVNMVLKVVTKSLEEEQAAIATATANYDANHKVTLSAGTKWSAATGTPSADIEAGKEAIRASTGAYPNVALLSAVAFAAAKNNPAVVERFKYVSKDSITTEMLAALWGISRVVVGGAVTVSDGGAFADIWGNNAVLAYVPSSPAGAEEPSYGYTYTLDGHPVVEQPYYDNNAKSWIYPVTMERSPVLSGIASGYLIQNPA